MRSTPSASGLASVDPAASSLETSGPYSPPVGDHSVDQVWSKAMSRYQRARVRPAMLVAMDTVAARIKRVNTTASMSSEDGSVVHQQSHEDSSSAASSSSTGKNATPKRRVVKSKPVADDLFSLDAEDGDEDKMDGEDADDDKIDGEDDTSVLDDIM